MKIPSIFKMDVIIELSVLNLVSIQIFSSVWLCLTLVWHHVTFVWIINEDLVNSKNKCHIWIPRPIISHHTKFHLFLTWFDIKMTNCHLSIGQDITFLWIINEDLVNSKNECQKWTPRPQINKNANFHLFLTFFDTKMTTCHFSINI